MTNAKCCCPCLDASACYDARNGRHMIWDDNDGWRDPEDVCCCSCHEEHDAYLDESRDDWPTNELEQQNEFSQGEP